MRRMGVRGACETPEHNKTQAEVYNVDILLAFILEQNVFPILITTGIFFFISRNITCLHTNPLFLRLRYSRCLRVVSASLERVVQSLVFSIET